jgi:prepilin-type N-terminal cleavage/methylation domain-containing protein
MNKKNRAFTLIELLVVMAIIMILASLLIVRFSIAQKKARDATRKSDLKEIQNALELYADDHNGIVPVRTSTVAVIDLSGTAADPILTPTYVSRIPEDVKKGTQDFGYWFQSDSNGKQYWLRARLEAEKNPQFNIPDDGDWDAACGGLYTTCMIEYNNNVYFRLGNG